MRAGSLGWEDPLEKEIATHSSILAWKNPMDRGAWQATVCGAAKSWTRLSDLSVRAHIHTHTYTHTHTHRLIYYSSSVESKRAWNSKILFAHAALSN